MPNITEEMKIGDILDQYPQTLEVFLRQSPGFNKLTSPTLRQMFAGKVSVKQAAAINSVDLEKLLRELNEAINP